MAVLESLNDFENLGALFRNAAAFGVDAVLLDPQCADPLYRRSVRVSMGHVLRVPFAVLPGPWPAALAAVRSAGFELLALTPDPSAQRACATSRRPTGGRCCWAPRARACPPARSPPPTAGCASRWRAGVDSLNVATAAAVAFAHLT